MASRGLNPMTVTTMILLVLTTLIFTVLFFTASNSITATREGLPEDARRKEPLDTINKEVTELRGKAAAAQKELALRTAALERHDIELSRFGVAFVGSQQIAGADGKPITYGGSTHNAKENAWLMTRNEITQVNERLEFIRSQLETRPREIFASLEEQIDARSREQQAVLARANDMDAEYRTDEEKLLQQKDEMEKKKKAAEVQQRDEYSVSSSNINKKEDHIRTLLEIELQWLKELQPVGSILQTVVSDKSVVIDLGSKDRVFAGLLFDVFQYEQGRYIAKGRIEVIDVQSQLATCRILSEIDGRKRPIAPGDKIGNPVFNPAKPPVFVLSGEFKQYNADDLANFIRATGGVVSDTLKPGCDFLVAGDRSDKIQDIAREYQIVAMTEDQLLKYVQTSFHLKADAK